MHRRDEPIKHHGSHPVLRCENLRTKASASIGIVYVRGIPPPPYTALVHIILREGWNKRSSKEVPNSRTNTQTVWQFAFPCDARIVLLLFTSQTTDRLNTRHVAARKNSDVPPGPRCVNLRFRLFAAKCQRSAVSTCPPGALDPSQLDGPLITHLEKKHPTSQALVPRPQSCSDGPDPILHDATRFLVNRQLGHGAELQTAASRLPVQGQTGVAFYDVTLRGCRNEMWSWQVGW
ncbi:hypothetical protein BDK51DRAFT_46138 [Blyttiomyces helicus]|uniref:Uncharacterized protein n=1 Tax=Blyttiomyces helicus TaxID=388810 RepID=A0A4P9WLH6_9FUNG|nr:hypothetical protein BDK51DRAFT_46138 [Blyttiomyces helicus]|eukprot:RKO92933.1 hypothetical protein BDK51DRAFT_46138 [Blyttiomyces helicus]